MSEISNQNKNKSHWNQKVSFFKSEKKNQQNVPMMQNAQMGCSVVIHMLLFSHPQTIDAISIVNY